MFLEKGYSIKKTQLYDKKRFSGKEIRRRIKNGEQWEDLVTDEVFKLITEINGIQRVIDSN